ncbi:hypothetical protein SGPA1_20175 [Streptomyces misionensis JCM 4497]
MPGGRLQGPRPRRHPVLLRGHHHPARPDRGIHPRDRLLQRADRLGDHDPQLAHRGPRRPPRPPDDRPHRLPAHRPPPRRRRRAPHAPSPPRQGRLRRGLRRPQRRRRQRPLTRPAPAQHKGAVADFPPPTGNSATAPVR